MDLSINDSNLYEHDLMYPGHGFCAGCSVPVVLRHAFRVIGPDAVLAVTAGCLGSNNGVYPTTPMMLATYNAPFPALGAAASGIRAGLDMQGQQDTQVIAIAGDGGIFDIGLQALSGSLDRGEDILYICYDNEAFMNTGIQRSSSSPIGAVTTTTPASQPELRPKKNLMDIIVAHGIPYAATASMGYLEDMIMKLEKAKSIRGAPRFLHIFSPCPVGWRYPGELTAKLARLAVKSRLFPLYEVENSYKYRITLDPQPVTPLAEYFKLQGRFRFVSEEQGNMIQQQVERNWQILETKTRQSMALQ